MVDDAENMEMASQLTQFLDTHATATSKVYQKIQKLVIKETNEKSLYEKLFKEAEDLFEKWAWGKKRVFALKRGGLLGSGFAGVPWGSLRVQARSVQLLDLQVLGSQVLGLQVFGLQVFGLQSFCLQVLCLQVLGLHVLVLRRPLEGS